MFDCVLKMLDFVDVWNEQGGLYTDVSTAWQSDFTFVRPFRSILA